MKTTNLQPEDIDRLAEALITLTKELWVVKDRMHVLETILAEAKLLDPDALSSYQPGPELTEALSQERSQLINNVLGALEKSS